MQPYLSGLCSLFHAQDLRNSLTLLSVDFALSVSTFEELSTEALSMLCAWIAEYTVLLAF